MIDAPYTGANVRITPFTRGDYIGADLHKCSQAPEALVQAVRCGWLTNVHV
jgi:hypothetical protein